MRLCQQCLAFMCAGRLQSILAKTCSRLARNFCHPYQSHFDHIICRMNERRRVLLQSFPCPLSNSDHRHCELLQAHANNKLQEPEATAWHSRPLLYLLAETRADVGIAAWCFLATAQANRHQTHCRRDVTILQSLPEVGNGSRHAAATRASNGHEAAPIKVEMGFVAGAIRARTPTRPDVRTCAS
jgi:hypothetical protein